MYLSERFRAKVTAIEESKVVDSLKIDELVGSLQTFEMTLVSPKKVKGIALKAIREESLSSKSEDDEKMLEDELTKFAKKFKKYMKFRKPKKESNDGKKWRNSIRKKKKLEKDVKKDLKIECFNGGGKRHYAFECSSKKKNNKAMHVTWSDSESNRTSENESNVYDECTKFITFAATIKGEPLLKKATSELIESSDSNDYYMSFDTAYETLYKECLSLKQEQVKWTTSNKILTNGIDVLKRKKKTLLDKIAFLENEHLEVKKKCDVLKNESQMFKDELSLRKEESYPSFKRVNELINSRRKSFDKRGLRFVDGNATLSNAKIVFAKPCEEKFPKKIHSHIKFHCTHCGKVGHTFDRCYATLFDNFQRKLTNLANE